MSDRGGTRGGASVPAACVGPELELAPGDLIRAQDAVEDGIVLLQQAQQTQWQSIAGDAMRAELYAAIQVLLSISEALGDARREVARCLTAFDEGVS